MSALDIDLPSTPTASSTSTSTFKHTSDSNPTPRRTWPGWAREPLLHFALLGTLVFALDHFVVGRHDDPRTIVIGASVDAEARRVFEGARGRPPTNDELAALRRTWLDNEVLYREGLALQVDKGDSAIRERVIFKALSVVDAGLQPPTIDGRRLREWFEARRTSYDEPARYDFQEAIPAGDRNEAAVRALVDQLSRSSSGDIDASLRVFKGRPHANVVQGYGEEFALALEGAPRGEWRAHRSRDGWRAMRLDSITAARPAVFDDVRGVVMQDWIDATMAQRRTDAVRALAKKYVVRQEGGAQ